MGLADIVQVTISSNSRGVDRASFGIPMVAGSFTFDDGSIAKKYDLGKVLTGIVDDSTVATGDKTYRALQALAAQSPKPRRVVVGSLPSVPTQTFDIQVIDSADGDYTVTVQNGTATPRTFTYAASSETADMIALGLAALIDADPDLTAAAATDTITVTASAPALGVYEHLVDLDLTKFAFTEQTVAGSIVTELQAIRAADSTWYGAIIARPLAEAGVALVAADIETQEELLFHTSYDSGERAGDAIGDSLGALGLQRSVVVYSDEQNQEKAAAWAGYGLSQDPGSITWAYKRAALVSADEFNASEESAMNADVCNRYIEIAGLSVVVPGKVAGDEWISTIRGRDWLVVRLRERIAGVLVNSPKVPYTQGGADLIGNLVEAQLREGIAQGYLSPDPLSGLDGDPPFIVNVPIVSEIDGSVKNTRTLPDVSFTAGLAGAIHAVQIAGVIQV